MQGSWMAVCLLPPITGCQTVNILKCLNYANSKTP